MLEIKDVRKQYVMGDLTQTALDGVSLNLRESELVAILGPSGSGKSTLLNMIGGLDRYDSGDLIIDGISTKHYSDRDWDSYRNHTVGFIFQSYNLIPHQTILSNVELALTISGVSKGQRRERAVKALEEVGLGAQLHKKPNQLSGGQMQRVAIARALVNDPHILLADEPTGALDSETSIQVMELIKKVSRDRLVVMVTHNPDLAYQYADRIVKVKDGKIVDDTHPYLPQQEQQEPPVHKNMGKASMSFLSALSLSFQNLKSKKGRTLMTAFAGSIGIIGIALILAISVGFQSYIDDVQEDTLANSPLTLMAETADIVNVIMPQKPQTQSGDSSAGTVAETPALSDIFRNFGTNDLKSFRNYLTEHYSEIEKSISSVQYYYAAEPLVYVQKPDGPMQVNPSFLFRDITGNDIISAVMDKDSFQQIPTDQALLNSQFTLLDGHWPSKPNELVFVLPSSNQLADRVAYTLGMKDLDSLSKMMELLMDGKEVTDDSPTMEWSYQDILDLQFQLVNPPDLYKYNEEYGVWEDLSKDTAYMTQLVKEGETLQVTGIVCPKPGSSATALYPGIGYLPSLTEHIIEKASKAPIVQQQLRDPSINVFTGKPFGDTQSQEKLDFKDLITIDGDAMSDAFGLDVNESVVLKMMEEYLEEMTAAQQVDTSAAQQSFLSALQDFSRQMLSDYLHANAGEDGTAILTLAQVPELVTQYLQSEAAQSRIAQLTDAYDMSAEGFTGVYNPLMVGLITELIARNAIPPAVPEISVPSVPEPTVPTVPETLSPTVPETLAPTVPEVTVPAVSEATSPNTAPMTGPAPYQEPTVLEEKPVFNTSQVLSPEESTPPDTTPPMQTFAETEPAPTKLSPEDLAVMLTGDRIKTFADGIPQNPIATAAAPIMGKKMMESTIVENLMQQAAGFSDVLAQYFNNSVYVDGEKLAGAFHLSMDEEEIHRLMDALSPQKRQKNAQSNLTMLGYADLDSPSSISFYMPDFKAKEKLLAFLEDYNAAMSESRQEEKVIRYSDMTAMMMNSVRTMIETISYSLIAFVAVSLVVSSIMIGIITYISVMERTKEIGILRAMGASKHNVSQVFNAETFLIGLLSGLLGVGVSLLLLIPGNRILHQLMGSNQITAYLPFISALILIVISMMLTLVGGLIPAHQAAKKDPVIALRSE